MTRAAGRSRWALARSARGRRSVKAVKPRSETSLDVAAHALRELAAIARPRPEPPARVAGVEALEDALALAALDARPLVGDDQLGRRPAA